MEPASERHSIVSRKLNVKKTKTFLMEKIKIKKATMQCYKTRFNDSMTKQISCLCQVNLKIVSNSKILGKHTSYPILEWK